LTYRIVVAASISGPVPHVAQLTPADAMRHIPLASNAQVPELMISSPVPERSAEPAANPRSTACQRRNGEWPRPTDVASQPALALDAGVNVTLLVGVMRGASMA
jgi:hypothetical protein